METENTLHEYMLDWHKGSLRHHIDADRLFVERYIRPDEFDALFGGKMLLRDRSGTSEFIGVWGRQEISRFKRVLTQRGAQFKVVKADAQDRVIKMYRQARGCRNPES